MGIRDRFKRQPGVPDDPFSPMPGFRAVFGEETRFVTDGETLTLMRQGRAQATAQDQFTVLEMLADEGRASSRDDGFALWAEEVSRLDDEESLILQLPPRFTGSLRPKVRSWTASADFAIELDLVVGEHPSPCERRGPVVRVGDALYRVSLPLLNVLRAVEDHAGLHGSRRTEAENVRLVARLQRAAQVAAESEDPAARDPHFELPLGALDQFSTVSPSRVGLIVERQGDGSLAVEPDLGPGVDRAMVNRRWHQLDSQPGTDGEPPGVGDVDDEAAVLRAGNTLVLLESDLLAGVREVRRRPLIPADEVRGLDP